MSNNTLILYYSQSGNTEKLANIIHAEIGGDIKRIDDEIDITTYECIFIGTPNHMQTAAAPVLNYIKSTDLSGKTIIPFCTHGTGGLQNIARDIEANCPNSTILKAFAIQDINIGTAPEKIKEWLIEINILS